MLLMVAIRSIHPLQRSLGITDVYQNYVAYYQYYQQQAAQQQQAAPGAPPGPPTEPPPPPPPSGSPPAANGGYNAVSIQSNEVACIHARSNVDEQVPPPPGM